MNKLPNAREIGINVWSIFCQDNAIENVVHNMAAILFRPRRVKLVLQAFHVDRAVYITRSVYVRSSLSGRNNNDATCMLG